MDDRPDDLVGIVELHPHSQLFVGIDGVAVRRLGRVAQRHVARRHSPGSPVAVGDEKAARLVWRALARRVDQRINSAAEIETSLRTRATVALRKRPRLEPWTAAAATRWHRTRGIPDRGAA